MTSVTTVGQTVLDRLGRRNEFKGVIPGLTWHRVLTRLGHMAFNAQAARTICLVVCMLNKRFL